MPVTVKKGIVAVTFPFIFSYYFSLLL